MSRRLSAPQMAMLKRIRQTGDPWRGLRGRSEFGGAAGTLASLVSRGLVGGAPCGDYHVTIDGKLAMKAGRW